MSERFFFFFCPTVFGTVDPNVFHSYYYYYDSNDFFFRFFFVVKTISKRELSRTTFTQTVIQTTGPTNGSRRTRALQPPPARHPFTPRLLRHASVRGRSCRLNNETGKTMAEGGGGCGTARRVRQVSSRFLRVRRRGSTGGAANKKRGNLADRCGRRTGGGGVVACRIPQSRVPGKSFDGFFY